MKLQSKDELPGGVCLKPSSQAEWLGLLAIMALGALLRCYHLGTQSLWFDEAASVAHSQGSLAQLLHSLTTGEGSPPLYFLLLHLVLRVGHSEIAVRAMSVVFGLLSIPLLYFFARALFGPATGLIAALLLAVSPFALYYSQEARPYALLMALSIASCYTLLLAVKRPGPTRWPAYGAVTLAALYTHYFAAFLVVAQGIVLISAAAERGKALRGWALSLLVITLAYLPWMPFMFAQARWQVPSAGRSWIPQVGVFFIPYTFFQFSLGYSAADIKKLSDLFAHAPLLLAGTMAFGAPFVAAAATFRQRPAAARWGLLLVLAPIAVALLVNMKIHCYQPAYLAGVMPVFLALVAYGIVSLRKRPLLLIAPLLMVPLLGLSLKNYYSNPAFAKEDWRSVAAYLERQAAPQDIIVFHKSWPRLAFDYYYRGSAAEYNLPNRALSPDSPRLVRAKEELSRHPAVWLVLAHNFDTKYYYRRMLSSWFRPAERAAFVTCRPIIVARFVPRTPAQVANGAKASYTGAER